MYKIVLYIALICIIFTTLSNAQRSPRASTTSTSSETPSNSVSRSTGASNSISASLTGSVSQSVTRTVTPSTTSTNTASATNTPSNAPSGAASNTPTNTVTPTASVTPSGTSSISVTPSGTSSSSVTPSNSGSSSITPSISGSSSNTPSSSATPSTTPSTTRSITATPSSSFIPIANNTVSCLYCNRESIYRSRNASSNAFIAASNLGLVSSSPSGTPSISTTPSNTPSISVTPSTTPSNTPSISVTPSITPSISTSSSPSSSASPSSSSSASASISGTSSNTPSISASSSISPSFSPSASALGNSSIINSQTICGTGSFRTDGGILTLVYNTSQQGAAYFNQTYNLTEGFLVQFDVHLYQPTPDIVTGPNGERYNKPADGFAFCAQQDSFGCNAVGYNGEGIGYDGIENALCVEFDVYFNNPYGDPDSDHIAVMASDALGALVSANHDSSSAVTPPLSLLNTSSSLYPRDGYPFDVNHTVRVTYDGTDEVLEVTLNGRSLILINSTKVRDLQLNGALLGFTSSTGGYGETVDISSFFARVPWSRPPSASPTPSASASASSGLVLIPTGLARKEHFDD